MFSLCYEISIIGKAFQKYKRPQGRAGQQAIDEFISKGKILLDLLLLLLAVLEAISIKFYRDIKEWTVWYSIGICTMTYYEDQNS